MAKTIRSKPLAILILSLSIFLILTLHFPSVSSLEDEENDDEEYVLDSPFVGNQLSTRSRFLIASSIKVLKKGASCNAKTKTNPNVCNGVSANKGTGLLYCCKNHCRNVLGDRNNCGVCGRKCQQWQRCCGGVCTNVMRNKNNCGKCNEKCSRGITCDYGVCGYA